MYKIGDKVWFTPSGLFAVEAEITEVSSNDGETWIRQSELGLEDFLKQSEGRRLHYAIDEPFYCSMTDEDGFLWPSLQKAMQSLKIQKSMPGRIRNKLLKWYRDIYLKVQRPPSKDPEVMARRKRYHQEMVEFIAKLPDKKVYIRRR